MASNKRISKSVSLHRSASSLSTSVSSGFQLGRKLFRKSSTGENRGHREESNKVEIIRNLSDLKTEEKPSLSLEDIRVWNQKTLGDRRFVAGPNNCTTNVAWLVGATHSDSVPPPPPPAKLDPGARHIDIYESSQPPSHLNVKEPEPEMETASVSAASTMPRRGYTLARSKSVCDLAYVNLNAIGESLVSAEERSVFSGFSETSSECGTSRRDKSTNTSRGGTFQRKGRVVRNRTILGSFPLFYKLSQSLSSLNTKATNEDEVLSVDLSVRSAIYDGVVSSGSIGKRALKCATFVSSGSSAIER